MAKTIGAYRVRLDDMTCDHEECEEYGETLLIYLADNGEFFHQIWCGDHESVMTPGSEIHEVVELWPPVDAEDEALVDDLVRRRMESKKKVTMEDD